MKLMFKNPQKKGKIFISYPNEKVVVDLNEIKIKNLKELIDKNGYFIECNIPSSNKTIKKIKDVDDIAYKSLKENYQEWFMDDEETSSKIDDIYINSYEDDMPMTIILSNKIEADIIIDNEEKESYELIDFINSNKKNKNYIINVSIILLGIYISKTSILNKWAIRYINIETIKENDYDWNRRELEDEWKYDLINFEEESREKMKKMEGMIYKANELFEEIIKETDIKIWENKLDKLKTIIFRK